VDEKIKKKIKKKFDMCWQSLNFVSGLIFENKAIMIWNDIWPCFFIQKI